MLENIYEMVCESKIVYGIEVWALSEAWKEADKVYSRFSAGGYAEMEPGREIRRGKCIGQMVKYHVFGYRRSGKTVISGRRVKLDCGVDTGIAKYEISIRVEEATTERNNKDVERQM